jgi:type VI secretion system secreted protein Hcp
MPFDAFINIDTIEGESTDREYRGWIEMVDFALAVRQNASATISSAGGASAEPADFSPFMFRKQLDKASPALALACAAGRHIAQIVVALCRAGTEKLMFAEPTA